MKKNRKILLVSILVLVIVASLVSGTLAVYTKTLTFDGVMSLIFGGSDNGYLIYDYAKDSKVDIKGEEISSTSRNDILKKFLFGEYGYDVSVNVGSNDMGGFGIYINGEYDENTKQFEGLCLQFKNGDLVLNTRALDFTETNKKGGNDQTGETILKSKDLYKQFSYEELSKGFSFSASVVPVKDSDQWQVRIFINGRELILEQPLLISPLHKDNDGWVGVRTWNVGKTVVFNQLNVVPLEKDEYYIYTFPKRSDVTLDGTNVSSKGRNDVLKSFYCGNAGYMVSIDVPANNFSGFGMYINGKYDEETDVFVGQSLQYAGSNLNMFTRTLDFNLNPRDFGTDKWVGGMVSAEDILKQFDLETLKQGHTLSAKVQPMVNSALWSVTLYFDGVEVKTTKPITISTLHTGEFVTVGFRTWSMDGTNTFKNLNVTPLSNETKHTEYDPIQEIVRNLLTNGFCGNDYFSCRTARGSSLDSTGLNYAPVLNQDLINANVGLTSDTPFSWRIWKGNDTEGYNIFFTYTDIATMESGESISEIYKFNTITNVLEKGSGKVSTKSVDGSTIHIIDGGAYVQEKIIDHEIVQPTGQTRQYFQDSTDIVATLDDVFDVYPRCKRFYESRDALYAFTYDSKNIVTIKNCVDGVPVSNLSTKDAVLRYLWVSTTYEMSNLKISCTGENRTIDTVAYEYRGAIYIRYNNGNIYKVPKTISFASYFNDENVVKG